VSGTLEHLRSWPPKHGPSDRRMVKFGEVVRNANLTERDPEAAGVDRIVGLDHLDPENLHIRRWNSLDDGTSFSRKFVPGQTLFGKRRAYQRKVAFAEFEGICSGDILTFEPKDHKVLLPELLPFICQADAFFDHALGTSAGSLSPRTSWKALQDFEFPLPPIEEQKRIAEILWAADEAAENFIASKNNLKFAKDVTFHHELTRMARDEASEVTHLSDICHSIVDGTHFTPTYVEEGIPFLRVTDIQRLQIDWSTVKRIPEHEHEALSKRCRPAKGDVLLSKNGTVGLTKVVDWDEEFSIFVSLCLLKPKANIAPAFLAEVLRSKYVQKQFQKRSKQGTVTNLHLVEIRDCTVPVPSVKIQQELISMATAFDDSVRKVERNANALDELKRQVLHNLMLERSGV
jgi:type I restriction enzyme, S subunit